jgi:hypothetical protein
VRQMAGVGILAVALVYSANAGAEPYLAVFKGMQCSACHSGVTGGGRRNAYGNVFAQMELPVKRIGEGDLWNGDVSRWLSVGMDVRAGFEYVDTPNADSQSSFDVTRGAVYLEGHLVPGRLSVYVDQQFAPDASINREAYVRYNTASKKAYFMVGQFYLPFGLRLQDDSSFVRQVTGVNFTNPDRGVQVGYESGPWSTAMSLSNGNGGAADSGSGKQVSVLVNFMRSLWRVGGSFNLNQSDVGDRQMQNVFAGLKTGPVVWLAEVDLIIDKPPGQPDLESAASLLEGNWLFAQGHNIKLTYDYFDPDRDTSDDQQVRYSALWEYTPIQFVQARFGARLYDGVPQVDVQNRSEYFIEIHGFF